jgi:hypothetical protein
VRRAIGHRNLTIPDLYHRDLLPRYRVRFARLSRIRTILGCPPEDEDIPSDAYKFVEDDEYLIVDLSLHWVSAAFISLSAGPC